MRVTAESGLEYISTEEVSLLFFWTPLSCLVILLKRLWRHEIGAVGALQPLIYHTAMLSRLHTTLLSLIGSAVYPVTSGGVYGDGVFGPLRRWPTRTSSSVTSSLAQHFAQTTNTCWRYYPLTCTYTDFFLYQSNLQIVNLVNWLIILQNHQWSHDWATYKCS